MVILRKSVYRYLFTFDFFFLLTRNKNIIFLDISEVIHSNNTNGGFN